jgi:hypothetical protein
LPGGPVAEEERWLRNSAPPALAVDVRSTSTGRDPRLFGAAGLLNAIGTGFYYPFALLFFADALDIGITAVGTILTVTTLASLPLLPLAGEAIDRWSGQRVLLQLRLR